MQFNCTQDTGWIIACDGAYLHVGYNNRPEPGTKVLMQVFGPSQWEMRYEWETNPS